MATNPRVIFKEYVEGYPREEHMDMCSLAPRCD
jgi:hypothetical protein